jgi:hypothetical protein
MPAARARSHHSLPHVLARLRSWELWSYVVTAVALALLGIGVYAMWRKYGDKVVSHQSYRLTADKIEVSPPPEWITRDVKAEVMMLGSLNQRSIQERDLAPQVADAFKLHPWVRKVNRVSKKYPKIRVDLEYRRPVAMVVVIRGPQPGDMGLQPVDADGVWLLPEDFTREQAQGYPRIDIGDTSPAGPPGSPWGNPRITGAAQIAAKLLDHWDNLGLNQIQPLTPEPSTPDDAGEFEIVTRDRQSRIIWGRVPGQESASEATAADKLAHLLEYVQQQGPLDRIDASPEPRLIDLRNVPRIAPPPVPETTGNSPDGG